MSLANNLDPRSSGLPDTSFYYKPDEAFMSMQNRIQLGLGVKDTLGAVIVPFTQMQNPSKNYQATPDRPLLDLSLINQRVLLKPSGEPEVPKTAYYQQIISLLPDELRAAFENPPLTDPLLIAMDKTFNGASTAVEVFDGISKPPPPDSRMEEHGIAFQQLPVTLSQSLADFGNHMLPAMRESLSEIGRNDPQYDNLSDLLNQTSDSFNGFQNLLNALDQSPPPKNLSDLKAKVSDDVTRLNDLYNSKDNGSNLKILGSFVNALNVLSSALTTENGNPSVMLASYLGNMGIETAKNPGGGVLGPGLSTFNQNLANGLSDLYLPNATAGDKQALNHLLNLTSVFGLGAASSLANANYGEASLDYPNLNAFGYEVGMAFLSNTSALPKTFGLIGSAAGIADANLPAAANAMSAAFLSQLVYVGAKGNASSFESLVRLVGEPLSNSLAGIENDVNAGISNGVVSGDKANAINVSLTHARLALENEDYEGFASALHNLFSEMGTNGDSVNADLKLIKGNGEVIQNAFNGATREGSEPITGIQRMA
jgi:hypothetical protein